jgi:hypothetical protein
MANIPNFILDVESPVQRAIQGFQQGSQLRQQQQQEQRLVRQEERVIRQEQQRAQLLQQQQDEARATQADLVAFSNSNPDEQDTFKFMATHPKLAAQIKQSFDVLTTGQKESELKSIFDTYSSLLSGKPEVAIQMLEKQKEAATNSGIIEKANEAEAMIKLIEADPNAALTGLRLTAGVADPVRFKQINEALAIGVVEETEAAGDIRKQVIKKQGEGASIATEEDLKNLPPQAFLTIGSGDDAVTLVKPVKPLTAEASTKFAVTSKAKKGAQELLRDFEEKNIGKMLRLSATKFAKKIPGMQDAATKLDLITEGLGRSLSGAAVPESEIKAFRQLFAVDKLDTDETIKFKLQRSVDIVNDLQNLIKFGADPREISDFVTDTIKSKEETPVEGGRKFGSFTLKN